jgi:hypothetical protein
MNKHELIVEICRLDSTQSINLLLQHDEKELKEYFDKLQSNQSPGDDIPSTPFH